MYTGHDIAKMHKEMNEKKKKKKSRRKLRNIFTII